jgi:hypothetical protein
MPDTSYAMSSRRIIGKVSCRDDRGLNAGGSWIECFLRNFPAEFACKIYDNIYDNMEKP